MTITDNAVVPDAAQSFLARDHGLYIGGRWVDADDGEWHEAVDPGTGEVLGRFALGGLADADAAVNAAAMAFTPGAPWTTMTAAARGLAITRLADLMEEHLDELAAIEALDSGNRWPSPGTSTSPMPSGTCATSPGGRPRLRGRSFRSTCRT